MSGRISEQRLNELFEEAESDSDEESAFGEIMDHRRRETALLLELRALAEDLNRDWLGNIHDIADKLDSLLAAHDAQQAEGKEVEILWCVHVIGPDEVIAAPSEKAAKERAVALNAISAGLIDRPMFSFAAQPWPHGSDSHARSLIEDWPGLLSRGNEASKNSVGSAQAEGKGE